MPSGGQSLMTGLSTLGTNAPAASGSAATQLSSYISSAKINEIVNSPNHLNQSYTHVILPPDQSQIIYSFSDPAKPLVLMRTGVVGDGNCFYHALFKSASPGYNASNDRVGYINGKKINDNQLVTQNAAAFTDLTGFGKSGVDIMQVAAKLLTNDWAEEAVVVLASQLYNFDIIILRTNNGKVELQSYVIRTCRDPANKKYIILYNVTDPANNNAGLHFESVGLPLAGQIDAFNHLLDPKNPQDLARLQMLSNYLGRDLNLVDPNECLQRKA